MVDLSDHFRERQNSILQEIQTLVEMESPTGDNEAATAVTTYIAKQLESAGATVKLYPTERGSHLVAQLNASAPVAAAPIMLLGHVDTVWPAGTLSNMPFRIEDGRAYGPGVFDMKSGVALMLEAARAINNPNIKISHPVIIFLSCDEERGSGTSRDLIEAEAKKCAAVLVFEPPLPGGIVKTERKGIATLEMKTYGVAAHAGLEPEKGVSAISEMAHQILKLQALNDLSTGLSVNIGVVKGGTYVNVVPAEAACEIEVRFRKLAQGRAVIDQIRQLQPVLGDSRVEITGNINRPPLERNADVISLFEKAKQVASEIGFALKEVRWRSQRWKLYGSAGDSYA